MNEYKPINNKLSASGVIIYKRRKTKNTRVIHQATPTTSLPNCFCENVKYLPYKFHENIEIQFLSSPPPLKASLKYLKLTL